MSFLLSKLLPLLIYRLGLGTFLLLAALLVRQRPGWQTGLTLVPVAVLWLGGNRFVAMGAARSLEWRYTGTGASSAGEAMATILRTMGVPADAL